MAQNPGKRLLSLDVMRGLIMILLAGESCMLYESLHHLFPSGPAGLLVGQFFHHPWHGLHFWDLVQPAFMLMAGASLYISWSRRAAKGISRNDNLKHVLLRCLRLFAFGTGLHCVYAGRLVWELWNVLTQLSVTTLIAYLVIRKSFCRQLGFSFFLLIATDLLYRYVRIPGFDQPFTEFRNFGAWADTVLMGKINEDGWVAINFIPTAAHTIWGCLAGKLLVSGISQRKKVEWLVIAGLAGLVSGFTLDWLGVTPIVKRISTSSFVLASGGWVLLILAFLYWLNDIRQISKYAWICTVVGMNAIFIYVFFETVGVQWFDGFIAVFVKGFLGLTGMPEKITSVFAAVAALAAEWYICFWLYRKNIFFKL